MFRRLRSTSAVHHSAFTRSHIHIAYAAVRASCNMDYTYGDSDVISSYQLFSAILWGKLCEMFVVLTSVDVTF